MRLIDADAIKYSCKSGCPSRYGCEDCDGWAISKTEIDEMPTIGETIAHWDEGARSIQNIMVGVTPYHCSNCGHTLNVTDIADYEICPNCNALMKEVI